MLVTGLPPALSASGIAPVRGKHAMVASVHELASQAGVEVLKAHGNAVDAAVATGFALAVVHPQAGNLGGGGFMLVRGADGKFFFLDFREAAPAAATATMYLDEKGNLIPDASLVGYRASGVPGSVAGLVDAEKRWGKLTLAQVMAPSIRLAREGFPLSWEDARDFRDPDLAKFPESRRIFQRDGRYYEAGEIFRQPDLARTLEHIAQDPDDFYKGAMAREIAAFLRKNGGLITEKDLAGYQVKLRQPVRGSYRGYEIVSAPPPSSGGIDVLEILNILEGYDLGKLGWGSAEAVHLTVEAFRRAYYDRAEFLGDPDFAPLPVAQLIDKKYASAWRESLDPRHATPSPQLKRPEVFDKLDRDAALHPAPPESANTTHYSIVDADGMAAAVTYTLNDSFGSRVTVPGLGFLLNDEMDDFASKPGEPNVYGLVQGTANAIAGRKRPLSSMTPTMVLKGGRLFLVLGSPGGGRIPSTVAQIILNMVDYGMNVQQAVNAARFHHQWLPDVISYEKDGLSPDSLKVLAAMGHKLQEGYESEGEHHNYWSDGECVAIDLVTGERLGASDPRNNGKPIGY
ncbi:MAG TPA: gamma-glutamyltransferase [Terriglobales bacterium]|nr:gamma-glutamyltransferase [Terriglobales bacterium]